MIARRWRLPLALAFATRLLSAQGAPLPVSRTDAVASAVERGARLGLARADTAVAYAQLLAAGLLQDPTLSASYSKATPNYHILLDQPLDVLWLRGPRVASARAARVAAQYRFGFERAAAALDADTTYTRTLAARERARLSHRNAEASDSLRRMVIARRNAGDASDLDVELAALTAGQAANVASADSLAYLSMLLDLQAVMGLAFDRITVTPTDSLTDVPAQFAVADSVLPVAGSPLQIAAAEAALESARLGLQTQRRSAIGAPGITAGIETGDPSGGEPGILPTVGVSIPLPLWNRNRGGIAQANAELLRARAELTLAQAQGRAELARARRELAIGNQRLTRDRDLVRAAERVAAMSFTAYREGASTLPNVLEAQRNARDVMAQYVDDLAAVWIAAAELRVLLLTSASMSP